MEKITLKATHRTVTGKQVGQLRRAGLLPAVIYGHNFPAAAISLDLREASKVLNNITSSSIINIDLEGKVNAVLVRERQRDYIRNVFTHIDFQAVSLTEKLRTNVSIHLTGIAPAVKDFSGVVVNNLEKVEVECLPQDLPERFVIDISKLVNIGDSIYVKDLVVSDKVAILTPEDETIVVVTATAEEPVVEEVVAEGAAEVEVIEKGKKEEEEIPEKK